MALATPFASTTRCPGGCRCRPRRSRRAGAGRACRTSDRWPCIRSMRFSVRAVVPAARHRESPIQPKSRAASVDRNRGRIVGDSEGTTGAGSSEISGEGIVLLGAKSKTARGVPSRERDAVMRLTAVGRHGGGRRSSARSRGREPQPTNGRAIHDGSRAREREHERDERSARHHHAPVGAGGSKRPA